jgi:hypothetical protein
MEFVPFKVIMSLSEILKSYTEIESSIKLMTVADDANGDEKGWSFLLKGVDLELEREIDEFSNT